MANDAAMPRLPPPKRLPALGVAMLLHVVLAAFLMLRTEATVPSPAPQLVAMALMPAAPAPPAHPAEPVPAIEMPQVPLVPRPKAAPRRQVVRIVPPAAEPSMPAVPSADASLPVIAESEQPAPLSEPAPISSNPAPEYPETARRKGIEGTVVLQVSVAADGQPLSVTMVASSGHDMLDAEAVRTVRRWRFRPALAHGRPVAGLVVVPITFELHS